MVIKCAPGSLDSRERHVIAAARVLDVLPVPVAVVMDPISAVVLDTVTGKVTGEGFDAIPTKEQLGVLLSGREPRPIAPEKLEREKRVLLAFRRYPLLHPAGRARRRGDLRVGKRRKRDDGGRGGLLKPP